ncbi:transport system permease protein [Paenibacillus vortex V453]|uniref:Iron ABC transporter permease n=2 Tax=Paenibacillus TaxID=44249 RepID=A0A163DRZ3_9BACL|nr:MULTISPECIES: iron ABC transporter permease [Paenibacillus]AWP27276.1 iron ABC transporter permease [Paenibacillus sp. Cedars]EFU39719.1 transport system permease protein [Paenibacillus vortex V453]KZS43398.1 iron ABC transporter permease [Paenibacillus glucanolyticus]MDH6670675.1 iron complex transport system permease protein [Paenibacillus sp. LBL]MPY17819.1 iron ABC transporter permease [Paenibacillus glucanolyticus]
MEAITNDIHERKDRKRKMVVLSVLGIFIVLVFLISMNTGVIRLSPLEVIKTLFGSGTDKQNLVLFEFRLPRIVISLLIGAGLAISGCIMQGISRNELADPGILGINAGAGLMVMLFISFFPSTTSAPIYLLPVLALIGAGLTAAIICVLAYKKNEGFKPTGLLLTGIAVAAGISAAMIVLTLKLSPEKYQFVATWLAGSIWGSSWKFVFALLPWIVVLLPYVMYKAQVMNVLNLGESMATGLGASVTREQLKLLAAAVGLAASCVAVSGGIGFVGLIAPHLARKLVGAKHQMLLPITALVGALLVITADTLGRWIIQPSEIPTGIVVAVIGAPYFLYLLSRSKG